MFNKVIAYPFVNSKESFSADSGWKGIKDSILIHRWFDNAQFIARGANAKLFNKQESSYPLEKLYGIGDVVKVICKSNPREALLTYFEMKLVHALFPENTINPLAMRFNVGLFRGLTEIHMDMIPVHPELEIYQKMLGDTQARWHNRKSAEWNECQIAYQERGSIAKLLANRMLEIGIDVDLFHDNKTNVSLFDPEHPVFFEPQIVGVDDLRDFDYSRQTRYEMALNAAEKINKYIMSSGCVADPQLAKHMLITWLFFVNLTLSKKFNILYNQFTVMEAIG